MTEAERELLLNLASAVAALCDEVGKQLSASDIRDAIQRIKEEQRNR